MTFKEWNGLIAYANAKLLPITNIINEYGGHCMGSVKVDTDKSYNNDHMIIFKLFDACGNHYDSYSCGACKRSDTYADYRKTIDNKIDLIMREIS